MKIKWIIPLIVIILLLIAWFCRWEQGPAQTEKDLKIIYTRDRWTGQAWIKYYGTKSGRLYSGEMEPIPEVNKVEARKIEIISSREYQQSKNDLEHQIIWDYTKIMRLHEQGNNEYINLVREKVLRDWPNENHWMQNYYTNAAIDFGTYNNEIPRDILEHRSSWINAKRGIEENNNKIYNMDIAAGIQAESELKTWAWQERKIVTYIWFALFGLSIVATALLARHKPKKE